MGVKAPQEGHDRMHTLSGFDGATLARKKLLHLPGNPDLSKALAGGDLVAGAMQPYHHADHFGNIDLYLQRADAPAPNFYSFTAREIG